MLMHAAVNNTKDIVPWRALRLLMLRKYRTRKKEISGEFLAISSNPMLPF